MSRITKYLMTILEHFCSIDIMIRDGDGAAVDQYVLAEADSDSDAHVDSNDSRRAVEVEDAVAGTLLNDCSMKNYLVLNIAFSRVDVSHERTA